MRHKMHQAMNDHLLFWIVLSLVVHVAALIPLRAVAPHVDLLSSNVIMDVVFEEAVLIPDEVPGIVEQYAVPTSDPEPDLEPEPEQQPVPEPAQEHCDVVEPIPEPLPPVGENPVPVSAVDFPVTPRSSNRPPIYPRAARRAGQMGTVIVEAVVTSDGSVEDAWVGQSSGHEVLDSEALRAVRKWKFNPAEGDSAISFHVAVPVRFVLSE